MAAVRPRLICVLAAAALAAAGTGAAAKTGLPRPGSAAIWATVDACGGGSVGIRGAMPGTGDARQRMYMSFAVEYHTPRGWRALGGGSGFVAVGSGAAREREAGWNFDVAGTAARTFLLRGVVTFQWRLHGAVVASAVRSTTAGHHASAGARPPGYSASVCRLALKRRGSFVITPVTPSASSRASSRALLTVHT